MDAEKLGQSSSRQNTTAHSHQRAGWFTVGKSWKGRKRKETLSASLTREQNQSSFVCNWKQLPVILRWPFTQTCMYWQQYYLCYLQTKDIGTYIHPSTFIPLLWTFSKTFLNSTIYCKCPRDKWSHYSLCDTGKTGFYENRVQWQTRHTCFRQNMNHIWNYNKTVATCIP